MNIHLPRLVVASLFGSMLAWATGAEAAPIASSSLTIAALLGQAEEDADALLERAAKAIGDGEVDIADSLISRVEKMNVHYGVFHTGHTPKKLRKQLEQKRSGGSAVRLPSARFNPFASGTPKPTSDATARDPFDTREIDRAAEKLTDNRQVVHRLLERGRDAVKARDLLAAEDFYRQAAESGATFGPGEYSPENLFAEIRAAGGDVRPVGPRREQRGAFAEAGPDLHSPRAQKEVEATATSPAAAKTQSQRLTQHARAALHEGDWQEAERLARAAKDLGVPDTSFARGEDRPAYVLLDIEQARGRSDAPVRASQPPRERLNSRHELREENYVSDLPNDYPTRHADGRRPESRDTAARDPRFPVERGVYRRDEDRTRNRFAQEEQPAPADVRGSDRPVTERSSSEGIVTQGSSGEGEKLFQQGVEALSQKDNAKALGLFREAYKYRDELDPFLAQRLQDHLQVLSIKIAQQGRGREPEPIESRQQVLARQLFSEVGRRQVEARRIMEENPRRALEMLQQTHRMVAESDADPGAKEQLLRRLDGTLKDTERYLKDHAADIELAEQNAEIRGQVRRRKEQRLEVDDKLAGMVEEFNKLMHERRYAEAELLAKRAEAMDPENPVVVLLVDKARFVREFMAQVDISDAKAHGFVTALSKVDEASVMPSRDFEFPDIRDWEQLTNMRKRLGTDGRMRRTGKELEIEQKLKTPVTANFKEQPLVDVIQSLGRAAGINVYLDPRGLEEIGIDPSRPVTISLTQEVSLKSALNLLLEPLELGYVIKDEVLKVTSDTRRSGELITITYPVADLVIPIPNFVPTSRMGLAGELQNAHNRIGVNSPGMFGGPPVMAVAGADGPTSATIDPALLAQINVNSGAGGRAAPISVGGPGGPGGLGGGAQADFEAITSLITTTVQPPTWDATGGPGSIKEFENNLTLVISQTQEIHEQIVDLLEQLRRLQDLQVTIEVRFITLADDFFERIGIDFDFDLDDNSSVAAFNQRNDRRRVDIDGDGINDIPPDQDALGSGDSGNSLTIGLGAGPGTQDLNGDGENDLPGSGVGFPTPFSLNTYTADLDLQFRQGSFGSTAPTIGGFNPATAATFGFAILSDIEAYFFLQAAQGDRRTNFMQAPKVTLFNGQQAYVSDTMQVPFVTSVIPVVGDFAAAHQPVIVVLSEGTSLTIQAVVSTDRRFVRLTVVPFFSKVGDVDTFTFNGKTTTIRGTSSSVDADNDIEEESEDVQMTVEGTTVQLPTFEFQTVSTTVSVPDGGTVLLGGVKRLREERREEGVPILSKIPYISRLFKNVGIGRHTESLMMMVTPRIIIQEEEEQKLGISTGP